jgi:hypothetical protein
MKMKKVMLALLALATAAAISPVASAQSYNFNFSDGTVTVIGTFTVSTAPIAGYPGAELITSFSGTMTDTDPNFTSFDGPVSLQAGTAPFTSQSGEFTGVTNYFYPSGNATAEGASGLQYFDGGGLVLNIPGGYGDNEWSLFAEGNGTYGSYPARDDDGYYDYADNLPASDLQITRIPEYGALSMLILSALTLAGGFFFKARQSGLFLAA